MTARTPTSAPGNRRRPAGFTLVELMVVLLVIALAAGVVSLALRDGSEARLEREALRLAALLEAGRAEARASGLPVRFELAGQPPASGGDDTVFRFVGLPAGTLPAGHWLEPAVRARIDGGRALRLGPEPMIGAQRIVLSLGERELVLATDGLSPFAVQGSAAQP